ncbi:hypothetical protein CAP36_09160 [Chitinophagaceae bacterium IBVUCB2]|nr:hypothetical protein CAP36_09160 [Chitinophagaceae bacterium IBVUCB2]
MRIVIPVLILAFFYALVGSLLSTMTLNWPTDTFIYSIIMSFFFILLPLFIAVCVFHLILSICKWMNKRCTVKAQIVTLFILFNLTVLLVQLPDFFRHQAEPHYTRYNSFSEYFIKNIYEGVITATIFSIVIPLLDNFIRKRMARIDTTST